MEVRTGHEDCDLAHTLWQFWIARHCLGVVPDCSPELRKGQPGIPGPDECAALIDRLETLETCLNALFHIVIKGTLLAFECLRCNKWKSHSVSPAANFRAMLCEWHVIAICTSLPAGAPQIRPPSAGGDRLRQNGLIQTTSAANIRCSDVIETVFDNAWMTSTSEWLVFEH